MPDTGRRRRQHELDVGRGYLIRFEKTRSGRARCGSG